MCQKPEESLSILELIQKRVHLLVQTPKSELEIVRKKLEQQLKQTTPHVEENVPRQMNCEVETANMKFEQEQMKWKKKERELNEKLSSTEVSTDRLISSSSKSCNKIPFCRWNGIPHAIKWNY